MIRRAGDDVEMKRATIDYNITSTIKAPSTTLEEVTYKRIQ